jgi:hypothetical protein
MVAFVENRGQLHARVRFYGHGPDGTIVFTDRGVELTRIRGSATTVERRVDSGLAYEPRGLVVDYRESDRGRTAWSVARDPATEPRAEVLFTIDELGARGARASWRPVGRAQAPTRVNILKGDEAEWLTGLRTYHEIVYEHVGRGANLVFSATERGVAYRWEPDSSNPRSVSYLPLPRLSLDMTSTIGTPDAAPWRTGPVTVLAYGSFFGTAADDRGLGVAVDPRGSTYVTGEGPAAGRADSDAFVAKFAPDGRSIEYVTYVGGSGSDGGFDVVVDDTGHAYVTGYTQSGTSSFPVTGGPDRTYNGNIDTLVFKLAPDGEDLVFAGYFGGNGLDFGEGIALDSAGHVYLTGVTGSIQPSFPAVVGPDLTFNGRPTISDPDLDAFVAKLVPNPTEAEVQRNLVYAGFIGGLDFDVGFFNNSVLTAGHIAVGPDGSAYVSGMTKSNEDSFPDGDGFGQLAGPDRTHNGDWDGWLARIEPDGTALTWAGYVGGPELDRCFGIAVGEDGSAYASGDTMSAALPGAAGGPDLTYNGGGSDALVVKARADGSGFDWLGYLGGDRTDSGSAVALGPDGALYVVGYTESSADSFPVVGGPDLTQNDVSDEVGDAFVCRLALDPTGVEPAGNYAYCGYIGGTGYDQAYWVVVDAAGDAYVVGDTESTELTFPDGDGFGSVPGAQQTPHGGKDAFLVKVWHGTVATVFLPVCSRG